MPNGWRKIWAQPQQDYPCVHCGRMMWTAWALRHAGYCEACEWMKLSEVAEYIASNTGNICRLVRQGKLRRTPLCLYHRADVDAYLASRRGRGTTYAT